MQPLYPATSRYFGIPTSTLVDEHGETVRYLQRRFVPDPERFIGIGVHIVAMGDRLDNVTARYLSDPEQFWRVCDANRALRPAELTEEPGRKLSITLPEGIPGTPHA